MERPEPGRSPRLDRHALASDDTGGSVVTRPRQRPPTSSVDASPPTTAGRATRRALRNAVSIGRLRSREAPAAPPPTAVPASVPPAELLRRLQFKVLRRLDGFLFGDVSGVFYGPSLDLAEVREYQAGDEVRRIDWHVTARTGVLHVRQYREEREIRGWLIVDGSPSMAFGTRRALKSQVALELAAAVASVLTRQGNKVGALAFGPAGMRVALPSSGREQVLRVLDVLQGGGDAPGRAFDEGAEPLAGALAQINRTVRRRSLVFLVSDFLERDGGADDEGTEPAWSGELRRLAARHDVIAVRVSDPAEKVLPNVGELRVRDPETGRELWLDTGDPRVREAHARLIRNRERMLTRTLRSSGADVLELSTAHDIVRPLVAFIRRRRGRRSGVTRP